MRLRIYLEQCLYDRKKGIIEIPSKECVGITSEGIRIVGKRYIVDWVFQGSIETLGYDTHSLVNDNISDEEAKERIRRLKVIIV